MGIFGSREEKLENKAQQYRNDGIFQYNDTVPIQRHRAREPRAQGRQGARCDAEQLLEVPEPDVRMREQVHRANRRDHFRHAGRRLRDSGREVQLNPRSGTLRQHGGVPYAGDV